MRAVLSSDIRLLYGIEELETEAERKVLNISGGGFPFDTTFLQIYPRK